MKALNREAGKFLARAWMVARSGNVVQVVFSALIKVPGKTAVTEKVAMEVVTEAVC